MININEIHDLIQNDVTFAYLETYARKDLEERYCRGARDFRTDIEDGKYYEATYNGDKDELYLDTYTHSKNECITDFSKLAF